MKRTRMTILNLNNLVEIIILNVDGIFVGSAEIFANYMPMLFNERLYIIFACLRWHYRVSTLEWSV